jgi:group II intron reverse transcriptase/maturase
MRETMSSLSISTRLEQIATQAKAHPDWVLTTLAHHIDIASLREAFRRTRKDGAVGVDQQTAEAYAEQLDANLESLLNRFKSGLYRAPPVRRVEIPKDNGTTRPIGIPTFEDKILQRAVTMVLAAAYEQDFLDCSYGFRPGRSAHMALERLWKGLMDTGGGWVLEVDIASFFDSLDHGHLHAILDKRVRDGVIRRVIGKWLNAGVLEDGTLKRTDTGTPQGGVISPLLANIYLHEVIDTWFHRDVLPRMSAAAFMVRYADDLVMVFRSEHDARRVLDVLPKRLGRYGLSIQSAKTRLVEFRSPKREQTTPQPRPGNFDFLGFTHHWARSRKGTWVVGRTTMRRRFTRALSALRTWCRANRHVPLGDQARILAAKLRGHYQYYGVRGNSRALSRFHHEARRAWLKWLRRRSRKHRMTWKRFAALCLRLRLPTPKIRAYSTANLTV